MAGAVRISAAVTGKPAPARAEAIEDRGREVVLVTRATGRPAARSCRRAATAPGSGRHDTVKTPSMSINTALMRMPDHNPTPPHQPTDPGLTHPAPRGDQRARRRDSQRFPVRRVQRSGDLK